MGYDCHIVAALRSIDNEQAEVCSVAVVPFSFLTVADVREAWHLGSVEDGLAPLMGFEHR